MQVIDGRKIAAKVYQELQEEISALVLQSIKPGLAVILVGDNAASQVYVNSKVQKCEELGIYSTSHHLPRHTSKTELTRLIHQLNQDKSIHGILLQLPLPPALAADQEAILQLIDPAKDVDGFHKHNAGALARAEHGMRPCTPLGIMYMLTSTHVPLRGAHAVVVGASNIVGKPVALLLLAAGATVTLCNSKTVDLGCHTRMADILVVATGKPQMINAAMVKPGSCVIDVGINRLEDGKLVGDVDYASVSQVAGSITPVPRGVGPMTIAMLMQNTVFAAKLQNQSAV